MSTDGEAVRVLWRAEDPDLFSATVAAAADALDVQALAVEKDYWVCQALNAIVTGFPGRVIFKGGTSLEKLRIISRFSEDLDLLVVGGFPATNAGKNVLRAMCRTAAAAVDGQLQEERSGGTNGALHRSAYLHRPMDSPPVDGFADQDRVLLELGESGGAHPSAPATVTSLLTRQLLAAGTLPVADYADLRPFDVDVLHPGRTLIEKLLRMNNFAVMADADRDRHGWPRIGRQFYDVWALLGDDRVRTFLADQATARAVLVDCIEVSKAFNTDQPPPAGGFARAALFDPGEALGPRLRREHDTAMRELYYGMTPGPTFDEVLDRAHEHSTLLDFAG